MTENNAKKKVVLVVEDDTDSRDAICTMLDGLGFSPLGFGSAAAALAGIGGKQIDIALLDIMMPEMNGYELMKELRGSAEFKDMPVIMVTARDQDSEILEGYQSGADYYITKPFTAKQLEYGIRIFLTD